MWIHERFPNAACNLDSLEYRQPASESRGGSPGRHPSRNLSTEPQDQSRSLADQQAHGPLAIGEDVTIRLPLSSDTAATKQW